MMLCACLALVSSPVSAARRSRLCTPTELTDGSAPSYVPKGRTGRGRGRRECEYTATQCDKRQGCGPLEMRSG